MLSRSTRGSGGGMGGAVLSRRRPVDAAEARRERAYARQSDLEADFRDGVVSVPQHRRRALQTPREQVLVRRLAEDATELAAEMRGGEVGGAREGRHVERVAVAGVDEVLRP